jgi:regulator of sigma E protease
MLTELSAVLNNVWLYGIVFYLVLMTVVVLHELGHLYTARMAGLHVDGFSFGFGKEVFGHSDGKGTRWSLRRYPLGGYVEFAGGLDAAPISPWKKIAVACAGPAMNFLTGILILATVYTTIGRPALTPYVSAIMLDSPAEKAGLRIGDIVQRVDGRKIETLEDMQRSVADKVGIPVRVDISRDGKAVAIDAVPKRLEEKNAYGFPTSRGYLGAVWPSYGLDIRYIERVAGTDTAGRPDLARQTLLAHAGQEIPIRFGKKKKDEMRVRIDAERNRGLRDPGNKDYFTLTLGERPIDHLKPTSPSKALIEALLLAGKTINASLGSLIQVIRGTESPKELGGVVRIGQMTGDLAQRGSYTFFSFVALLSISLGMINLLPLPLLDGGHIVFLLVEIARGKPVSQAAKAYIYGTGFILLMLLGLLINLNDMIALLSPR